MDTSTVDTSTVDTSTVDTSTVQAVNKKLKPLWATDRVKALPPSRGSMTVVEMMKPFPTEVHSVQIICV